MEEQAQIQTGLKQHTVFIFQRIGAALSETHRTMWAQRRSCRRQQGNQQSRDAVIVCPPTKKSVKALLQGKRVKSSDGVYSMTRALIHVRKATTSKSASQRWWVCELSLFLSHTHTITHTHTLSLSLSLSPPLPLPLSLSISASSYTQSLSRLQGLQQQ